MELFLILAFFAVCAFMGYKLYYASARKQRERAIEAGMRQDIADAATQKKVAAKLLHEAGEKP